MSVSATDRGTWDLFSPGRRRAFLVILFLIGTCNNVDKNIVSVLLEQIRSEFHASDTLLGLLSGIAYAAFYASFGIPFARWSDHGNRKIIITTALVIWSVMTVLCGFATSFWMLMLARFGVGAGEAGAMPPAQSLLADYYSPTERAAAIGIFLMSAAAGYAVGLVLGGYVAQSFGWRNAFVMVGVAGLLLAPLSQFILQEPRALERTAIRQANAESTSGALRILFSKRAYRYILAAIVTYFVMGYGVLVFVVSLLIRLYGLNVATAGATFGAVSAIGAVAGNLAGGMLSDRLARRDFALVPRVAGWGMIAAVPIYEGALMSPELIIMVPLLLVGQSLLNAVLPPMFAALHLVCGSKRRAMSVAVAYFFANLVGLGLGPVITGQLSDRLAVIHGSAEGLRLSMMIVMCILVLAGWFMLHVARLVKADVED